ncbi:MAG: sigma-70 family RNA polymerase sigma factor [Clostridia bacterium]|nr:sigma-70 family RNA polymerase sigma factor [Clostridia bacterium]
MTGTELESVIRRYADMVYRLAMARLANPADAEDIFQDVFLRYAEKAPAFRDEEHRKAWLLRVTVNCCKSHFRSPWFRQTASLEEAVHTAAGEPEQSPLTEALATLPGKYRIVLHLHYFEDLSTQEIAAATGQRASTVRSQLTRARGLLRKMLKGEMD